MPSMRCWFCSICIYSFISISFPQQLYFHRLILSSVQFSLVTQSCPTLCDHMNCSTPGLIHHQLRSSLRLTSTESVMPSSHLILCHPLLLLPPIPPSIRVFSNESPLHMRWPKYWSFSLSISPSSEHSELISFRMDSLDLLEVQGTCKCLLQYHSSKASILWHSAFFTVQLLHPYMTTGKTIVLTRRTFFGKLISLLFNMLSKLVINFLPRLGSSKVIFMHGWEFGWLYIRAQEENPRIDVEIYSFYKNKKRT